jgi:hypothetical protein
MRKTIMITAETSRPTGHPLSKRCDVSEGRSTGRNIKAALAVVLSFFFVLTAFNKASGQQEEASPTPTPAASPSPSPSPEKTEEQKRLEEENATLTLQKTNAQLKKDIRDARPTASATPLEGKATLDANVNIEAEIISYKTMSALMDNIAGDIQQKYASATRFFIYNQSDINDWRYYRILYPTFKKRAEDLGTAYDGVIVLPAGGAGSVVDAFEVGSTIIKSLVDFISMFRTDTEIQGKSVTIDDGALVSEAVRALSTKYSQQVTVYNSAVFVPQLLATSDTTNFPFTSVGTPTAAAVAPKDVPPFGRRQNKQVPFFASPIADIIGKLSTKKKTADAVLVMLAALKADLESVKRLDDDNFAKNQAITEDNRLIARYAGKLNDKKKKAKLKPAEVEALEDQKAQKEAEVAKFTAVVNDNNTKIKTISGRAKTTTTLVNPQLVGVAAADLADPEFIARKIDEIKTVNTAYGTFIDSAVKIDAQAGASPLTLFVKGETMEALANDDNAYWLVLKVDKAGGNNRIQRNLIRYFTGPKITYNGAAIVTYAVYDRSGRMYSDTKQGYSHFMSSSKIQGFKATADGTQ